MEIELLIIISIFAIIFIIYVRGIWKIRVLNRAFLDGLRYVDCSEEERQKIREKYEIDYK